MQNHSVNLSEVEKSSELNIQPTTESEHTELSPSFEQRANFNKSWRDKNFKIFVEQQKENLTLPECYDREITKAHEIFNKVEQVANKAIPKDKYLLFVDMANPGGMGNPKKVFIDPDRLAKVYEAETGSSDINQDFQSANMRFCFGFKPGDLRFRTLHAFTEAMPTDLRDCVGIILSGSEANIKDETVPERIQMTAAVAELVKQGRAENIPMFGICFGSQLLNSIFRAQVDWIKAGSLGNDAETGLVLLHKTPSGKFDNSPLAGLPDEFYVHANHKQEVIKDSMPQELEILASSDTSQVQIVQLKGSDMVLAIQNHIECGDTRADILRDINGVVRTDPVLFQGQSTKAREILCPYFLATAGKYAQVSQN